MFFSVKNALLNGTSGLFLGSSFLIPIFPSIIQEVVDKFKPSTILEIIELVEEEEKGKVVNVVKKPIRTRQDLSKTLSEILAKHKKAGCEFQFQFENQDKHHKLDTESWSDIQMAAVIRVSKNRNDFCKSNKISLFRKSVNAQTGQATWFYGTSDITPAVKQ